ncbi:hypothetical protein DNTS_004966 [Danionella cerebrum]|uniref:Uncharacterized protein n=1 Tax=Danionella cerebrum TaxID=2873325 RepID=A0A553QP33_9TELE|nr:hypothetical protein DNTS_004966 [Danionella translucida]
MYRDTHTRASYSFALGKCVTISEASVLKMEEQIIPATHCGTARQPQAQELAAADDGLVSGEAENTVDKRRAGIEGELRVQQLGITVRRRIFALERPGFLRSTYAPDYDPKIRSPRRHSNYKPIPCSTSSNPGPLQSSNQQKSPSSDNAMSQHSHFWVQGFRLEAQVMKTSTSPIRLQGDVTNVLLVRFTFVLN